MRVLLLVTILAIVPLPGCAFPFGDDEGTLPRPTRSPTTPPPDPGPPIVWGGRIVDAVTGEGIDDAQVRLDLAQTQPCRRQGVGWSSWTIPVNATGGFGPFETSRPDSDDVAFFLHVSAPGRSENATYIGPAEARAGTANFTIQLHPDVAVSGEAPAGTLVALDAPGFPVIGVANANGSFFLPHVRAAETTFVAATLPPHQATVTPPASFVVVQTTSDGWRLEGDVRTDGGRPAAVDIAAYNGTQLYSVARSSAGGAFSLPLPSEPVELTLIAKSQDGRWTGSKSLSLNGQPALRETMLVRAAC